MRRERRWKCGRTLLSLFVVMLSLIGCQKDQNAGPQMKTLRIKVSAAGEITVEGQAASLEQVSVKLADLKKKQRSRIVLPRRSPSRAPSECDEGNEIGCRAQVAHSSLHRADFSDAVDDKGALHPAKQ